MYFTGSVNVQYIYSSCIFEPTFFKHILRLEQINFREMEIPTKDLAYMRKTAFGLPVTVYLK